MAKGKITITMSGLPEVRKLIAAVGGFLDDDAPADTLDARLGDLEAAFEPFAPVEPTSKGDAT